MLRPRQIVAMWLAIQLAGHSGAAHAYLDPGTGSILIQGLIAGIAGAVAVVGLYWQRLKSFLRRFRRRLQGSTSSDDSDS